MSNNIQFLKARNTVRNILEKAGFHRLGSRLIKLNRDKFHRLAGDSRRTFIGQL
jgi:hypothetical protein